MPRKILDLSQWQPPEAIDYDVVSQQVDGVILRAGYTGYETGKGATDTAFERHYAAFTERSVPLGVYWICVGGNSEMGLREGRYCLERIRGKQLPLGVWADTEWVEDKNARYCPQKTERKKLTAAVLAYCETINGAGYATGVYASEVWFTDYLYREHLKQYPWWVAKYGNAPPAIKHALWQYTSTARLKGYSGNLDLSYDYREETGKMEVYHAAYGRKVYVSCLIDPKQVQFGKPAPESLRYEYHKVKEPNPYEGHRGLDTVGQHDQPIMAGFVGTVTSTEINNSSGKTVWIKAKDFDVGYAHLKEVYVKPDDKVSATTVIGKEGATGNVTGKHLHTWIKVDGKFADPLLYVTKQHFIDDTDDYEYELDHPIDYAVDTDSGLNIRKRPIIDADVIGILADGDPVTIDKRCDYHDQRWGRLIGKPWHWICLHDGTGWLVATRDTQAKRETLDPPQVYMAIKSIQGYTEPVWAGAYADIWPANQTAIIDEIYIDGEGRKFGRRIINNQAIWYYLHDTKGGWSMYDTYTVMIPTQYSGYDLALRRRGDSNMTILAPDGTRLT